MRFLRSALLNGLFILLPLVLLLIGLNELVEVLADVAIAIVNILPLPPEIAEHLPTASVLALLLVAIAAISVGVAARVSWISSSGRKFETAVLDKVPGYRMIKLISSSLIRTDSTGIAPALLKDGSGGGDPCYIIEKFADGRAAVLLPWSPASFSGSLKIVQQENLELLTCSLDQYSRSLSQMGVGLEECVIGDA